MVDINIGCTEKTDDSLLANFKTIVRISKIQKIYAYLTIVFNYDQYFSIKFVNDAE